MTQRDVILKPVENSPDNTAAAQQERACLADQAGLAEGDYCSLGQKMPDRYGLQIENSQLRNFMPDIQSSKPSDVQWYIQIADGKKAGPTTFERLQQFVKRGRILSETKIRKKQPGSTWVPAHTIPGLFDGNNKVAEAQQIEPAGETVPITKEPILATPAVSGKKEKKGSSVFTIHVDVNSLKTNATQKAVFRIHPGKSGSKKKKSPLFSTVTKTIESAVIPKKKAGTISLFLMVTSIFSVLLGLGGGLMLTMLGPRTAPRFSVTIGVVVFLFGIILGIVSWSLMLLFNQLDH